MSQSNSIAADDPRLTAYALGAMEPDEASAFEALLEKDADARAEVEAIRALAGDLEGEFADLPRDEGLDDARREAVLAGGADAVAAASAPKRGSRLLFWSAAGLAASVLIAVPVAVMALKPTIQERARVETQDGAALVGPTLEGASPVEEFDSSHYADGHLSDYDKAVPGAREGWNEIFPEEAPPTPDASTDNDVPYDEATSSFAGGVQNRSESPALREPADPAPPAPPVPSGTPTTPPLTTPPMAGAPIGGRPLTGPAANSRPSFGQSPTPTTPSSPQVGYIAPKPDGSTTTSVRLDGSVMKGGRHLEERLQKPQAGAYGGGAGFAQPVEQAHFGYFSRGGTWGGWNARVHGEQYTHPGIDGFMQVTKRGGHTSTFSVDVDSASYSNVRRILNAGQRPHPAAVRIEEFVNYFDYGYAPPAADAKQPFAQHIQVATCPWNVKHRLVRIALKGKEIQREKRPASNLVFLVDVSGSMRDEDKLPLLQSGLEMLTESLDARDRVSIVTYSNNATLALESTRGDQRDEILAKIRSLKAGGGTNGAGGIQLAYAEAQKHFDKEGINRVILCTDGDFNVGVSDGPGLTRLVQEKAKNGVYLSVLGFGTGNLQDGKMEAYSNAGNGNYAYIDSLEEAKRVLVEEMEGTLITIAKDVKFQVWFNPKQVHAWRLLGYENRRLAAKDFNDDTKDAGDIGAGHEVTALYELVPTGVSIPGKVDPNPFVDGTPKAPEHEAPKKAADEPQPRENALFIWRLRWKQPDGDTSELVERNVFDAGLTFEQADPDFQWAASVTGFGMLLRHSPHRGTASYGLIEELAEGAKGEDPKGRRAEFLGLVKKASGR